ncbi:MAG TPA: phosphoribosylanthranilate isomerase [Acidimicrobiales bacterium]|nr:phosphoribosylanthranilate isomerase [Acidimicrobiales bacterium]
MFVQIYGITTAEDAAAVDRLGPDSVGVVLDEGVPTWDSVDADTARAIVKALPHVRVAALSLSTDPDRILATVKEIGPDIVHLARADAIDDGTLQRIRAKVEPAKLLLTVPVDGPGAIDVARRLSEVGDSLLLDTKHPDTGIVGATGHTHDWSISADIVNSIDTTVVLAGGLGPDNVRDAITAVRPFGVDSETRTSLDTDRRRKDIAKVESFISLARSH